MPDWTALFERHIGELRLRCEDTRQRLGLDHVAWAQYLADRAELGIVTVWNFRRHPERNFTIETLRAIDRAVSEIENAI